MLKRPFKRRGYSGNSQSEIEENELERIIMEQEIRMQEKYKLDLNEIEKMKIKELRDQLSKLHLSMIDKKIRTKLWD